MIPISFCLIVKNEEKNIDKCLSALTSLFDNSPTYSSLTNNVKIDTTESITLKATNSDTKIHDSNYYEIVVVDTGSTDQTISIAAKYASSIYHFEWINDFSAARNFAMKKAKHNYVLFLDADEFLEQGNLLKIQELIELYPSSIGRLIRRNVCPNGTSTSIMIDKVERLFDRRKYHYEGSIHEQVISNDNSELTAYEIPFTVYHEGYLGSPEQLQQKAKRNNILLFKELDKNPNDPYLYYQLGQSYDLCNDHENAYKYYLKCYELSPDYDLEYVKIAVVSLGQKMLHLGKLEEVLQLLDREYNHYKNYADFLCFAGYIHIECGMLLEAIDFYSAALDSDDFHIEGSNSFLAYHNLACIYEAFGNECNAIKYYTLAGEYPDSIQRLADLKNNLQNIALENYNSKDIDTVIYAKKVSIIINCQEDSNLTLSSVSSFLTQFEKQTIGISHLEIIIINTDTSSDIFDVLNSFENKYSNNVLLINCIPDEYEKNNPMSILWESLNYCSTDYVCFLNLSNQLNADTFRLFRLALIQGDCDVVADSVSFQNQGDFFIEIKDEITRNELFNANLVPLSSKGKMYYLPFLKNIVNSNTNILDSILNKNGTSQYANRIYCLSRTYIE